MPQGATACCLAQPSPAPPPAPPPPRARAPSVHSGRVQRALGAQAHLLVEDRLGLATEARLFPVVPPLTCESEAGRRRSTQRAEGSSGEGAGMARHGSGVELRATRAEAAETDGCGGRAVELANRVGSSDSASHRCTGCAVPGPRRLERLGGSKEGEWMEGGAAATRPSHPSRRHRGSSPPALHQRLAHTAAASPLQLASLAGKHSSTGSRG